MRGRLLVSADWHWHAHRVGSVDGGRDRLRDGLDALTQSFKLAQQHDALWVGLGDYKEPRTSWPVDALAGALGTFAQFPEVRKVMLRGNHDGDGPWGSGLSPFREHATLYETSGIVTLPNGVHVMIWPSMPWDPEWYARQADDAARRKVSVLLGHLTVASVLLGPTAVQMSHVGIPHTALRIGQPYQLLLLGDVHRGQWWRPARGAGGWVGWDACRAAAAPAARGVSSPSRSSAPSRATWARGEQRRGRGVVSPPPAPTAEPLRVRQPSAWKGDILYPGSPYAQSWGEVGEAPRGVLLVDLETGQVDLLPIHAPRFLTLDLTQRDPRNFDVDAWRDRYAGDCVRVLLSAEWIGHEARVQAIQDVCGARTFEAHWPPKAETTEARSSLHAGMSPDQILREYIKTRPCEGVPDETVYQALLKLWEG